MSGNNKGWRWTPERLMKLRKLLDGVAGHDIEGSCFIGPVGLSARIFSAAMEARLVTSYLQLGDGLKILVFLNVLEPGKAGNRSPAYKRRYHPNRSPITWSDITRYRESRGARSPNPPGR